jgi:hypothetical protein
MATSPAFAAGLRSFFFLQRPPNNPLFFLNGHKYPQLSHLERLENWHHSFGDSEGGEVP